MQSGTEGRNMFFSKRKKIQYEREYEKERPVYTHNKMKRPPALYVVYAKSVYKSYCGFPFANRNGHKFYGFRFENYKRAIEYTQRFRSEEAALHQVERLSDYYNRKRKCNVVFRAFKIEAEEEWSEARDRWQKEYYSLEVKKDDE